MFTEHAVYSGEVMRRGGSHVGSETISSGVVVVHTGGIQHCVHRADPSRLLQLLVAGRRHVEQRRVR